MQPGALLLLLPLALAFECPIGWSYEDYTKKCYLYSSTAADYISAEQTCLSLGGHLVDIHGIVENNLVASMATGTSVWIGMNNLMSSGWAWTSGAAVDFTDWMTVIPQSPSYAQCAALSERDFNWRQFGCEDKMDYVCQAAPNNYTHATPTPVRCPGDIYCSPGYTLYPGNNICYKYNFTAEGAAADAAECHAEGATLVKIDSADLNAFLLNLSRPGGFGLAPIIGLSCSSNSTGDCYWFDGTPLITYSNFAPGEPGGYYGGGNVTFMSTGDDAGTWFTTSPTEGAEAILCQKNSITAPEYMEALRSRNAAGQELGVSVDKKGVRRSRK